MFHWLKTWWQERIIQHAQFTDTQWQEAFQHLPLLHRLTEQEKIKLKRLAILFLHSKSLESVGDLEITPLMQLYIALQACLPILYLGLDWYRGWVSVMIYPSTFSRNSNEVDEYGVVHQGRSILSGESWQRGPVILSWDDSVHRSDKEGRNVIIHEFAHKLDMLNGKANGFPPLHGRMSAQHWTKVFKEAYADFNQRLEEGDPVPIDSYAATSPGEFFAVFTEVFFEAPAIMKQCYPEVYELLVSFYRQDPLNF
ncbi:M90 family metallopeptidase [Legionella fallonii]|uniref:Protein MtfA n=1 Tax=Legionella fallonii LLAP-10 TaxID=1212491 RepID=A0A098G7Y4_9GAMM|nr:M90 family metallopeptidase [Legionella fallonii]CEG58563.1 Protein MtfA [Legionella fallonii LLAP-10]